MKIGWWKVEPEGRFENDSFNVRTKACKLADIREMAPDVSIVNSVLYFM